MKKFLSATVSTAAATVGAIAAAFALATSAVAAPLNTRGIPADAAGVIHVDCEALAKTPFGAPVHKLLSAFPDAFGRLSDADKYEVFKKETGINPQTDLHSITVGVLPPVEKTAKRDPLMPAGWVVVFRGKYSPQKFLAFCQKKDREGIFQNPVTIGKHKVYRDNDFFVSFVNESTLVMGKFTLSSEEKTVIQGYTNGTLAALDGTAKSYTTPAPLLALEKQVGTPLLLGSGNLAVFQFPPMQPEKPDSIPVPNDIHLALGVSNALTKLRIAAKSANEEDAATLQAKLQMGIALAQMAIAQQVIQDATKDEANPSELKNARKKFAQTATLEAQKFLGQLKLAANATNVELSADHSTPALAALLNDAVAELEAEAKARKVPLSPWKEP